MRPFPLYRTPSVLEHSAASTFMSLVCLRYKGTQHIPPKVWQLSTKVHDMTYQKTVTLVQTTDHLVWIQTSLQPQGKTCDNCSSITVIEI